MNTTTDNVAASRMDGLDRLHGTAPLYRRIDDGAKSRAKAAFLAYEAAVRAGDTETALAARGRFIAASAALAGARRNR